MEKNEHGERKGRRGSLLNRVNIGYINIDLFNEFFKLDQFSK